MRGGDTAAGRQEILYRRIGGNELDATLRWDPLPGFNVELGYLLFLPAAGR